MGFPCGQKTLRIRPQGYFFKLRSILVVPGPKIQHKSKKKTKKVDFQKSMENGSEPITGCSCSCRIRFWIQNWPKTDPKPDFSQFYKNPYFIGRRHRPEAFSIARCWRDDKTFNQHQWPSASSCSYGQPFSKSHLRKTVVAPSKFHQRAQGGPQGPIIDNPPTPPGSSGV